MRAPPPSSAAWRKAIRCARVTDLETELRELLEEANNIDPFAQYYSSRSLGDRIVHAYTQLDDWPSALSWVERGFRARPGRLRRALMDQLFDRRGFVDIGGLVSYGTHFAEVGRRAGIYVGRVLSGEKPADLPVEQPTKYERRAGCS